MTRSASLPTSTVYTFLLSFPHRLAPVSRDFLQATTSATTTADLRRSLPLLQIPPQFPLLPFLHLRDSLSYLTSSPYSSFPFTYSGFLARRSVGWSRSCCGLSKYGTSSHQVHRTGQRTLRLLSDSASRLCLQNTYTLPFLQLTNVGIAVCLT